MPNEKSSDPESLALLQKLEDDADLAVAKEVLAEVETEGTVSWDEVKAELEL